MKYTYRFVNGETRTIEVSEEQYRMLTDEDRLEYNNNQTNMTRTGRFVSLDMVQDEEGMQFANPCSLPQAEEVEKLKTAIECLPHDQRRLLNAIYFEGMKIGDYARTEGVSQPAISQRLKTVQKNLKKLLNAPYI